MRSLHISISIETEIVFEYKNALHPRHPHGVMLGVVWRPIMHIHSLKCIVHICDMYMCSAVFALYNYYYTTHTQTLWRVSRFGRLLPPAVTHSTQFHAKQSGLAIGSSAVTWILLRNVYSIHCTMSTLIPQCDVCKPICLPWVRA